MSKLTISNVVAFRIKSAINQMQVNFTLSSDLGSCMLSEVVTAYKDGSVHIERNQMLTLMNEEAEAEFSRVSNGHRLFDLNDLADALIEDLESIRLVA
ncbi:hypothetical protein P3547_19780 [Vibrio parahaemolyticus]|nr:hypothetical protein [Vibrio parahaemolyticus]